MKPSDHSRELSRAKVVGRQAGEQLDFWPTLATAGMTHYSRLVGVGQGADSRAMAAERPGPPAGALLGIQEAIGCQTTTAGTIWDGLALDDRPPQGDSPLPYLTLREFLAAGGRGDA